MKNKRLTGFIFAILVGLVLGLVYGWFVNPPQAKNAKLDQLRSDYQADYVLMVAEKFSVDQDNLTAAALLRNLSPDNPLISIRQAQITGQQLGYSEREMQVLSDMEDALVSSSSAPIEAAP